MTDHFDSELNDSGLDPTPAYRAQLEFTLADAYDGVAPPARSQTMRRGVVIGAAAAVVVAAIVGVIALNRTSGRQTIVDTPPTDLDTTPGSATTLVPTTHTAPASTVAATATTDIAPQVSSSFPTTVPPPTTGVPDFTGVTTIDLGQPAPPLQPTTIASYPQTPPGDLFATSASAIAPDDRVAVVDLATGELRFIDASTGAELSHFTVTMPTAPQSAYLTQYTFVGPDDVLYLADLGSGGNIDESAFVAYAPSGDSYVEVARRPHGFTDAPISLGPTGIDLAADPDNPVFLFVGADGKPSGATLDIDPISDDCGPAAIHTYGRSGRTWRVAFTPPPDVGREPEPCSSLSSPEVELGPGGTLVVSNYRPTPDGDIQLRYTILGDDISSYDSDWQYIGATSDALVFAHSDQDSIDIGTVTI